MTWLVKRVTQQVPIMEQELPALPELIFTACAEIGTDIFRLEAEETIYQLRKFPMK
jgi:hypothetical protein